MIGKPIKIAKKDTPKGEDGYKVFSIRIKEETMSALENISNMTNRSRNEIITMFLEYAVNNWEIDE